MAKKRIGITGGIGAGKSAVTEYLRSKGFTVIDADEVQREATRPGEIAMLRLEEEIGDDIFLKNGELDRPKLANLMFSDPSILYVVNLIMHSDIHERMERKIAAEEGVVFLSVPLLFETKERWNCDSIWLVTADEDIRLSRTMARDGAGEADVRARMAAQMPEDEKRAHADVIIENNGTLGELYECVDKQLRALSLLDEPVSNPFVRMRSGQHRRVGGNRLALIIALVAVALIVAFGVRYYNGYWFFFDMPDRTGWFEEDGEKRYRDRHANIYKDILLEIDSEKYYFDSDGSVYTGEIELDGYVYSFDKISGVMQYGWIERGEDRYYYDVDGHKIIDVEFEIEGRDFLFDENGAEFIGAVTKDGKDYYYEEFTGKLRNGEKQLDNIWFYYGDDGARIETGWVNITDDRIAYYNGDEGMLFGEQTIDGKQYLLNISMGGRLTGTVYYNGAVYTIDNEGVVQNKKYLPVWKGIDVSVHQEANVDWAAVAESGVQFAIVRAGYLAAEEQPIFALDEHYAYNVLEAQKNGISVGAYLYMYNFTMEGWVEGIDAFHAYTVENRIKLDLPVFLDIENEDYFRAGSDPLGGYAYRTSLVRDGMEYLRSLGYSSGFYTFHSWAEKVFDAETLYNEGYPFWLARWYNNNSDLDPETSTWKEDDHPSVWQFRATGQVPGIRKEVDMNYLYWDRMHP